MRISADAAPGGAGGGGPSRSDEQMRSLAAETLRDREAFAGVSEWIFGPDVENAVPFGDELGRQDEAHAMLGRLLEGASNASGPQPGPLLGGYLAHVFRRDTGLWEDALDAMAGDARLAPSVPEATWRSGMTDRAWNRLAALHARGTVEKRALAIFACTGRACKLSDKSFGEAVGIMLDSPPAPDVGAALALLAGRCRCSGPRLGIPLEAARRAVTDRAALSGASGVNGTPPASPHDWSDVPELQALQLYNSTVYRWNRPCYGVGGGKPHLRIECRALPAGPTTLDEMANAVLWIGAVLGIANSTPDFAERMDFDDAKANFLAASRVGLHAGMSWLDGESGPADRIILEKLLPAAEEGLAAYPVAPQEVAKYLDVVRRRVEAGVTGASWALRSMSKLKGAGTKGEQLAALTAATVRQQAGETPVAEWGPAELHEAGGWKYNYLRVEQYMTTSLTTVNQDELVELVAYLMDLRQIRHVLIEDKDHRLVGIVSYRSVLRLMAEGRTQAEADSTPVSAVMERDPVTVAPETPTLEAIRKMREHGVSALPVVRGGQLVGLVSETDFMPMAYQLLEDRLQEE